MSGIVRFALLVAAAGALSAPAQTLLTAEELSSDWKISRQFTVAVAEAMPEDSYGYKPTEKQMSFGEQMFHIAYSGVYRFHQLTGAPTPFALDKRPEKTDKATAILYLNQAFDYVLGVLPKITPEQTQKAFEVDWKGRPQVNGRQMMLNMFVHVAHHRAAAEVYLRLKGIEPPQYAF